MFDELRRLEKSRANREAPAEPLAHPEDRFRQLFQTLKEGIVFTDMSGKILQANPAYQELLGYTEEELEKLTYQELTPLKWHERERRIVLEQIAARGYSEPYEKEYRRKDGSILPINIRVWLIRDGAGQALGMWGIVRDLSAQKESEAQRQRLVEELQQALAQVKQLSGILPICAACKRIRDAEGEWHQIEQYLKAHTEADFSHGICPKCLAALYPELQ